MKYELFHILHITNSLLLWSRKTIMYLCRWKFQMLGAVILQDEKHLAENSKPFRLVQKFCQYVYGRTTEVEADCKPLQHILNKPSNEASLRL